MISLLSTIKDTFSRELITHIAARLGESESATHQAVAGIVPVVLAGLINQANTELGATYEVHSMSYPAITENVGSVTAMLGILGSGSAPGGALMAGETTVATIFGTSTELIAGAISAYTGVQVASARTLLSLVGAMLPLLIEQHAASAGLQKGRTAAMLMGLKTHVRAMLPQELRGLTGLLWLGGLGSITSTHSRRLQVGPVSIPRRATPIKSPRWYQALHILAGIVLLASFILSLPDVEAPALACERMPNLTSAHSFVGLVTNWTLSAFATK